MTKPLKDVGASVSARLQQLARAQGVDFQLLLTRYVNERLLYRLSVSPHAPRFVLKGAALFTIWTGAPHRATRDVDLLGFGESSEAHLREVFRSVLGAESLADGVLFDLEGLTVGPIREEQTYGGLRMTTVARVAQAQIRIQVDVGFGDTVTPAAELADFPALLEFPAPRLRAYPRETVIAEKVEAMTQLGLANSRMKDFFDIVLLSKRFDFEGDLLAQALRATFERRGTPLPEGLPVALTETFAGDPTKNTQWKAFVRKAGAGEVGSLADAIAAVAGFVARPLVVAASGEAWGARWPAGGPWSG